MDEAANRHAIAAVHVHGVSFLSSIKGENVRNGSEMTVSINHIDCDLSVEYLLHHIQKKMKNNYRYLMPVLRLSIKSESALYIGGFAIILENLYS